MKDDHFRSQLEAICNNASVALFLLDERQHCRYMNPAAVALTGYTLEEVQGRPLHDLIHHTHPDGSPYPIEECPISHAFPQQDQKQGEDVFVHKNGHFYDVYFSASPIRESGNIVGTVAEVQDITEQKRRKMHQLFLSDISKDLSSLSSVDDILGTVGARIGTYLKVQTCSFHDIDESRDSLTLAHAWRDAPVSNRLRSYRISDYFSEEFKRASRTGEAVVVDDTQRDPRTDAPGFSDLGIGSFVTVPMLRHGQWKHLLSVTHSQAREWRCDEIELIRELADRVFLRLERARAEEALREKEVRYRSLFEAIHQGFGVLEMIPDAKGELSDFHWLETNPAFEEHTGFASAPGFPVSELVPGIEKRWAEIYGRIARTGEREDFTQHSEALGRSFEVEAFRIGDPEERRVAVLFNDITERRAFEEALRESEQRYRNLFSSMTEGFCVIERIEDDEESPPDFRFVETNAAFIAQSGLGSTVGKTVREVTPLDAHEWNATYDSVVRTGHPLRFERGLVSQGRILELYAYRVEDDTQRRVAVIFSDITRHKEIEEALRTADRRKDEFLAILAHELRNPLGALRNTTKLLERHSTDANSRHYLAILDRQSRTLNGLVDDLLDVSRVTRGLVALKLESVNLSTVIERVLENAQPLIEEKHHTLRVTLPDQALVTMGDPVRLEQIFSNLLTNAIKYTDPDGRIDVTLRRSGDRVELRVRDNGIGMTPEVIERVFDLFGQAERGLARSQGGLGIGLTIVRNLVELHGGQVEANSAGAGGGAEFTVTLPLAPTATDDKLPQLDTTRPTTAAKRVLVVDDNEDIASTLALLLEHAGHQVIVANDGSDALAKAKEYEPEVILLDIGLPGMDGYEVARRLRRHPATRDAVLAAITGYGQAKDVERARAAGFDRHFTKPVEVETLEAFVSQRPRQTVSDSDR